MDPSQAEIHIQELEAQFRFAQQATAETREQLRQTQEMLAAGQVNSAQAQHDWQLSWIGAEGKMAGITEYGNSGWVQNANKRYCGSEVIACPSFCTHHTLMCLPLLAQSPPASTST